LSAPRKRPLPVEAQGQAHILFGVGGPSSLPRKLPVSTCGIAGPEEWPILCHRPVELWYHWHPDPVIPDKGRSSAHKEPSVFCPGCAAGIGRTYVCYLACWDQRADCKVLRQLTGEAVLSCRSLWPDDDTDLYGLILRWGRRRPQKNAPVWAKVVNPTKPWSNFPAVVDVQAAVMRLYNFEPPMTDAQRAALWEREHQSKPPEEGEEVPF